MIDISIMKTATVADLRNSFRHISAWIDDGQTVNITRHGRAFAQLSPIASHPKKLFKMPDFAAQAKKIWGDHRVLTAKEVCEMREFELEGEEG